MEISKYHFLRWFAPDFSDIVFSFTFCPPNQHSAPVAWPIDLGFSGAPGHEVEDPPVHSHAPQGQRTSALATGHRRRRRRSGGSTRCDVWCRRTRRADRSGSLQRTGALQSQSLDKKPMPIETHLSERSFFAESLLSLNLSQELQHRLASLGQGSCSSLLRPNRERGSSRAGGVE